MSEELTPLERAVVALSRKDPVSSLRPNSRKRGWILGLPTAPLPLANPRLEALRRYAILRRVHGAARIGAERERLQETGFSRQKIEEVDELVDPSRKERRARSRAEGNLFIFDGSCFPAVRWN
ncbi:hypothetical protein [Sphingomonas psychrotolerans]|uniref:hypothetical protein n=1 Tax=Sphingomonas psychrotolerans TaxID=1327635 RepID=UPI0013053B9E|nr:hypothetical protein [Sphingomonas psychrotolerans]